MRTKLSLLLLLVATISYGQFEDKKWIVGADLGSPINISELTIYPNVAYAINSNTIIGLNGSGRRSSSISENLDQNVSNQSISSNASLGVFLKKYRNISEKWFFNVQVGGSISWSDQKSISRDTALDEITNRAVTHGNGFSVSATPGISYQPLNWMIVEGNLGYVGYSRSQTRYSNANNNSNYNWSNFSTSIQFGSIGVKFIL